MKAHMLAAVYHGPHDLRLQEWPVPEIGPQEALLRVASAGICGTDLRILYGEHRKYPAGTIRVPGHEVVGDIVQVGEAVRGLEVNQRVFVAPNMGCGRCRLCASGSGNLCVHYEAPGITFDGAFAEYMRIPTAAIQQGNVIPIDVSVDPAAAALIEPFACVLRGQNALHIQPGETVLVIGVGPIGAMHIMLARLRGAGKVIASEVNPARLTGALEFGADRAVNPQEENLAQVVAEETGGWGADVVIVATPVHQAQEAAPEMAAIGGRINFFGGLPKDRSHVQLNANLVHYKELVVTGTTACSTYDCWQAAAIVGAGRVNLGKLVSRRFPLSQVGAAFQAAEAGQALKVILEP